MKLKPPTLILLAAALVLGIAVYLAESQNGGQTSADGSPIFEFQEDQVQAFTLRLDNGDRLSFEQADDAWQMTAPEQTPASDASVAYLLNLLATASSDRTLTVPASDLDDFGLDDPLALIQVELDTGETRSLTLGDYDFNRSFLYAQTDASASTAATPDAGAASAEGEVEVLLIPATFENAVSRPLEEWQASPEASSEQPVDEGSSMDAGENSAEDAGAGQ